MLIKTLQFVTIILVALVVGLAFAHVLERPAKMQYDGQIYITIQKTLYAFWGPPNVGGILEPAAIVATVALCLFVRKDRRSLWLTLAAALMLLIAFPVIFYIFVEPSNSAFRAATPNSIPSNWIVLRERWETGHTIRFMLQLAALSCLVFAVVRQAHTAERQSFGSLKNR